MADLAKALDAALSKRYPWGEPKSPATSRRGLEARMNHLEKKLGGRGPAAKAAGIGRRTWDYWRAGKRPPSPANLRKLEAAYARQILRPKLLAAVTKKGIPVKVTVSAVVRWSKSPKKKYNPTPYRTVKLDGLRLGRTIQAWISAGPEAAAQALEEACERAYGSEDIGFEGDDVEVEFP